MAGSTLERYSQRDAVIAGDASQGAFGAAQSVQNITHGSMSPVDYIDTALSIATTGEMTKGKEESLGGEQERVEYASGTVATNIETADSTGDAYETVHRTQETELFNASR